MRGRGRGAWGRGRGAMVLDNRPTSILVSAIPPELQNEDTLLTHFKVSSRSSGVCRAGDAASAHGLLFFARRPPAEVWRGSGPHVLRLGGHVPVRGPSRGRAGHRQGQASWRPHSPPLVGSDLDSCHSQGGAPPSSCSRSE